MEDERKTVVYQGELLPWVYAVQKREGFTGFSQTVNWIIRKAKESETKKKPRVFYE